jgi:glucose-1-phosphate adenylyltransferase
VPDDPDISYASMGNYIFTTEALVEALRADAEDPTSVHDMGGSIMPWMVGRDHAWVYDFAVNDVPGATDRDRGYWRDVGTIDAYYDANMDLVNVLPIFNLYNDRWPIYTHHPQLPPAKFVNGGLAQESIVGAGCIVSGAWIRGSVLSTNVTVRNGAMVEDSVIMDGVEIGEGAIVRRAILDKNVVIEPGSTIGVDLVADAAKYHVSDGGIVVLGKSERSR